MVTIPENQRNPFQRWWNLRSTNLTGNLEYSPERGAAIDAHFDDFWLWGERLVTVNMLSGTWLSMTCQERPDVVIHVPMPRRSLIAVYGEARYTYYYISFQKNFICKPLHSTDTAILMLVSVHRWIFFLKVWTITFSTFQSGLLQIAKYFTMYFEINLNVAGNGTGSYVPMTCTKNLIALILATELSPSNSLNKSFAL